MTKPNALHHIAISTADKKQQIAFFSAVLGMEVAALYCVHVAENTFHGLEKGKEGLKLNRSFPFLSPIKFQEPS